MVRTRSLGKGEVHSPSTDFNTEEEILLEASELASRHSVHMEGSMDFVRDTNIPMDERKQTLFRLTFMYMQFNVHKEDIFNFFQGISGQVVSEVEVINWAFTNGHITSAQFEELMALISQAAATASTDVWRKEVQELREANARTQCEVEALRKDNEEVKSLLGEILKALSKKKASKHSPVIDVSNEDSPPAHEDSYHAQEDPPH